jgi:hypothetical protein
MKEDDPNLYEEVKKKKLEELKLEILSERRSEVNHNAESNGFD